MTLKHVVNIYEPPYVLRLHLCYIPFFISYPFLFFYFFFFFSLHTHFIFVCDTSGDLFYGFSIVDDRRYLTAICLQLVLSFYSYGIAFCGNYLIYLIAFSTVPVFSVNAFVLYAIIFVCNALVVIYNCSDREIKHLEKKIFYLLSKRQALV